MQPHEYIVMEVARERERQMTREGWTAHHDDAHDGGEMSLAAACYCVGSTHVGKQMLWPWSREWWKPKNSRHDLVRAAALIVAEIERIDRASARKSATV